MSTTDELREMLRKQEEEQRSEERMTSRDGKTIIVHPGNKGVVIGDLHGDFNL